MRSWYRNRVFSVLAGVALFGLLPAASVLAVESKTISSVEIDERENGVTRIILRGAEDPIYTAFMREDPPRLIVELPDVVFDGVGTPIAVGNGVVNNVTLGAFGDPRVALSMARVSIGLERESEYELLPDGDELVIEIRPKTTVTAALAEDTPVPAAAEDPDVTDEPMAMDEGITEDAAEEAMASEASAPAPEPTPELAESAPVTDDAEADTASLEEATPTAPTPAIEVSRILSVTANGDQVTIHADGPIDNVDPFTLDAPHRLVVDFWGVRSKVSPEKFDVTDSPVERIRVGEHTDKVRVVFDLTGPLASHEAKATGNSVTLRLVSTEAEVSEEDVPAAPAGEEEPVVAEATEPEASPESSEPMDETEAVAPMVVADSGIVESVHFESLPDYDRVVISLSDVIDAQIVEPDESTIIVTLKGATIADETERRVVTADFRGPVEMFSVFQTPDVGYDEVRVVLKRKLGAKAELDWDASQLHVRLARTGGAASGPAVTGAVEGPTDVITEMAIAQPAEVTQPIMTTPVHMEVAPAPDTAAQMAPPAQATPASFTLGDEDDLFGGPSDPASIDILEEGGFNDEKVYTGRRVSLDFKDADIANIMRLIAEVSDLNVIAGEEVTGKVTIRLVDVPWDQALDVVLLTRGLGFVRVGNVLRIAPLETLKLEAEQRLQERRAKEKLEDLIVKLQPVNFADVKEIQDLVKRLLSSRGSVNVDSRTNTLIIKDIPSVVHESTALIKAIDTQTPQVMIESKIVEATLGFSRSLGAVWGLGYRPGGVTPNAANPGGGQDFHLADGTLPSQLGGFQRTNFLSSNPVFGALNGLLNLGVLAIEDQIQLDLQLQAAESTNKGKVISSPRVVTLDNREATIKQGVAIKFESATSDRITISFVDAVLELKVTPHITANRSIIMKIKVSRNAPEISETTGDIVGIAKNETETEALVKDGETIVLGGIYVVDSGGNYTKTPFLSDVPLLGTMFKSRFHADERRELLVFVTPRIILGTPTGADL